jgi:serine/threonine-protein kinase
VTLRSGTRIGSYEITGVIGAGGMGEVYRARDTKLDRNVAIKVLPELFATDPDRLARFEREAKTLASLNHPNIAHIHGLEEGRALVLELVEGEDLAERLVRGPIPLDEAVPIARQIADALEAAHELGIVHRDLKPANVKVRDDGMVKVLDFGLAKALTAIVQGFSPEGSAKGLNHDAAQSPTFMSPAMTQMGVILGTAAYMSPEQARGKPADRRADIWAFGCVLYEMLTGKRPFAGDDISMTLAAVLKENVDFTALPLDTPPSVARLVRRCLEKDAKKRLSSIADARLELDDATIGASIAEGPLDGASSWRTRLLWGTAGALVAGAATAVFLALSRSGDGDVRPVVRSQITIPDMPLVFSGQRNLALAPDGSALVFSAARLNEEQRLYRRSLADETVTAIAGTEGGLSPVFSPDGQWLAFQSRGQMNKMPAGGGPVTSYGDAIGHQGASFGPDGTLIFNRQHGKGLFRVRPGAATAEPLTTVDSAGGEAGHHWPDVLPDGKHVLYTLEVDGKPYSEARIMLLSLDTGKSRLLIEGGSDARYLPTGHIAYWRLGDVWAVPFDLRSLQTSGAAVVVVKNVMLAEANGVAFLTVAANGTMAYVPGPDAEGERSAVLVDRSGAVRPITTERKAYDQATVSPDGTRLALTVVAANDSIYTVELDRGALSRVTFEAENSRPVWSPDATRLAFTRHFGGEVRQMYLVPADGGTPPEILRKTDRTEISDDWSRVGNVLAFTRVEEATGADIWTMSMDGERKARPWLATRFEEFQPHFSPDARWIAYTSTESGRTEVYVRSYPDGAYRRQVSFDGGVEPRWRSDGRELFYRRNDEVLATEVTAAGLQLRFSVPRVLFTGEYLISNTFSSWSTWDVLPDGKRFIFLQDFARPRTSVTLVQNWFQELTKRD